MKKVLFLHFFDFIFRYAKRLHSPILPLQCQKKKGSMGEWFKPAHC